MGLCRWCTSIPRSIAPPRPGCAAPTAFCRQTLPCSGRKWCPTASTPAPAPWPGAMPMCCCNRPCGPAWSPGAWVGCATGSTTTRCSRTQTTWSASMTSAPFGPRPVRRHPRSKHCGASASRAVAKARPTRRWAGAPAVGGSSLSPTPFCTTSSATSWVAWSPSARAGSRRNGCSNCCAPGRAPLRRPPLPRMGCIFWGRSTLPVGACPSARLLLTVGHETPGNCAATCGPHPHQNLWPDARRRPGCRRGGRCRRHRPGAVRRQPPRPPPPPRPVPLGRAAALARRLPPFVTPVLLFVNAPATDVLAACAAIPGATIQFHGDESAQDCLAATGQGARPYLRAARIPLGDGTGGARGGGRFDLVQYALDHSQAQAILLDAHVDGYGGSGKVFNWSLLPPNVDCPLVLSAR